MLTEEMVQRIENVLIEAHNLTGWKETADEPQCLQDAHKYICTALACLRTATAERLETRLRIARDNLAEAQTRIKINCEEVRTFEGMEVPSQKTLERYLSFNRHEIDQLTRRAEQLSAEIASLEHDAAAAREQEAPSDRSH